MKFDMLVILKMNKEQVLGRIREVLAMVGFIVFGSSDGVTSAVGLVVAIVAVVWALRHHEGVEIIFSSFRKLLSAVPGALLAFDLVSIDTAGAITALIAPVLAMAWSFVANHDDDKGGGSDGGLSIKSVALVVCVLSLLSLPSCSVAVGLDGKPRLELDVYSAKQMIRGFNSQLVGYQK